MGHAFGVEKIISLSLSKSYWRRIASKGSVLPCICLTTSHHSSVRMSVGGSEELPAWLPFGTGSEQRCQGALDKEIGLCISKGHWKQMRNRGATARPAVSALKRCVVFSCLSQPLL